MQLIGTVDVIAKLPVQHVTWLNATPALDCRADQLATSWRNRAWAHAERVASAGGKPKAGSESVSAGRDVRDTERLSVSHVETGKVRCIRNS